MYDVAKKLQSFCQRMNFERRAFSDFTCFSFSALRELHRERMIQEQNIFCLFANSIANARFNTLFDILLSGLRRLVNGLESFDIITIH